ncbi:MAG: leucine-rich repeat domain-containing protein [Bacteroidales bacterium]|nr:leucine-rich repeat domain-containing protein [Bacteroidales bacterium]
MNIPEGVTAIHDYAFINASGLTSVTIGNAVTSIGDYAFSGCSGLVYLTIGNAVTSIGDYAFSNCRGINVITIPNTVTSVGDYAFWACSVLATVTIGNAVASIGDGAFYGCCGLSEIHSLNTVPPTVGINAFNGVPDSIQVYVLCGRVGEYADADGWSQFTNFVEGSAYAFTAVSNNNSMGTVQILTMPTCTNSQAVVSAVANSGYRFDHWSDGATTNPYSLNVTGDMTLTAYFVSVGGGTEGIDEVDSDKVKVYARGREIVIEGVESGDALVYDVMGRIVHKGLIDGFIHVNAAGIYMVKVGEREARKVVVR